MSLRYQTNAREQIMVDTKGKVVFMWKADSGKYFAKMQYWVGTGYQYVEREVTQGAYEGWKIDNE